MSSEGSYARGGPLVSSLQYPVDRRFLMHRKWSCQLTKDYTMEKYHPRSSSLEPATYQICILGTLDEQWSDYCGGMTIEKVNDPQRSALTFLSGRLADQCA